MASAFLLTCTKLKLSSETYLPETNRESATTCYNLPQAMYFASAVLAATMAFASVVLRTDGGSPLPPPSKVRGRIDNSYLAILSQRDLCSQVFPNSRDANCAPDITLCCTRLGQDYPSCERHIGKGWCCVNGGEQDECYVDQVSVCSSSGAVHCTVLKEGTTQACCPYGTFCDATIPASPSFVRCRALRGALVSADAKTQSTLSSTPVSSAMSSAASTTSTLFPTPTARATSTPEPNKKSGANAGTVAGAAVGGVAGVALLAAFVWFFMRRKKKHSYDTATGQSTEQPTTTHKPPGMQEYHDSQPVVTSDGSKHASPNQHASPVAQPSSAGTLASYAGYTYTMPSAQSQSSEPMATEPASVVEMDGTSRR